MSSTIHLSQSQKSNSVHYPFRAFLFNEKKKKQSILVTHTPIIWTPEDDVDKPYVLHNETFMILPGFQLIQTNTISLFLLFQFLSPHSLSFFFFFKPLIESWIILLFFVAFGSKKRSNRTVVFLSTVVVSQF